MDVKNLIDKVDETALKARPLTDWRPELAKECQVYVFEENYLAKRFDQINYKFCGAEEAKEILVDNLYALLRYKYFPRSTEEIDERIDKIVKSFIVNIKSTLIKVSFDADSNAKVVNLIPDYCIAFRNGVYNFKDHKWLFKYETIYLKHLNNIIYKYDENYVIQWYFNYDFEDLGIDIQSLSINDFVDFMKDYTKTNKNYCFELMYNMSHDINHNFNIDRFKHLCEILGYTVLQSFSQNFVLLIGSGQNGKNSLFDGCFSNRVCPKPASNDLDSLENDRFITGSLENKAHNIFLETSAKTYTESKMIKALTGSMFQTIESKGVSKYSGIINCKYIFAGNDKDKIKFSDNTTGFTRRINMFEIFYHWDSNKRFLKQGDYYDTTFSDSLVELKRDITNTTIYIYFAMYGILSATKNFTRNFKFNYNDWSEEYVDMDFELKEKVNSISLDQFSKYIKSSDGSEICKTGLYDESKVILRNSSTVKELGCKDYNDVVKLFSDLDAARSYFADHDIYVSLRIIQQLAGSLLPSLSFTQNLKKIFNISNIEYLYGNKPYVKIAFIKDKLKFI